MKRFTIEITDLEYQAMSDILVDPRQWARDAVRGKVASCVKKVVRKEQDRLVKDPAISTIPATVDGILESHFAQPDYKTRAHRDGEEEADLLASMNLSGSSSE